MAHPFTKILESALGKSTEDENKLLDEALKIKDKGYSPEEIHRVLTTISQGRIDDAETEIAEEALEEFSVYLR